MKYSERTYNVAGSCTFRKIREAFGGLSNMSTAYPIEVNGIKIPTTEALYQACRYPHLPEIQLIIINQTSPMAAKMKSKANYQHSRSDWEEVKVSVMRWCLRIKLAHHFFKFGCLLESTFGKDIVEESKRDRFWGAQRIGHDELRGVNALGRLLMELRQFYCSEAKYNLLFVEPPKIGNFLLLSKDIEPIDKRFEFILSLLKTWQTNTSEMEKLQMQLLNLSSNYCEYFSYSIPDDLKDKSDRQEQEKPSDSEQEDFVKSEQEAINLSLFNQTSVME